MSLPGVPEGYGTLSPYLVVEGADELIAFVAKAFGTKERRRVTGEGGGIHSELEVGDSVLMVGEGGGMSFPAMLHVYVEWCGGGVQESPCRRRRLGRGAPRHELRRPSRGLRRSLGQPVVGRDPRTS